jgi:hypothetical protein
VEEIIVMRRCSSGRAIRGAGPERGSSRDGSARMVLDQADI